MHILVYSVVTKATRRKAAVHYASHSLIISRKSEKSYA